MINWPKAIVGGIITGVLLFFYFEYVTSTPEGYTSTPEGHTYEVTLDSGDVWEIKNSPEYYIEDGILYVATLACAPGHWLEIREIINE